MPHRLVLALIASLLVSSNIHAQVPGKSFTDSLSDPLPAGAVARLGTLRYKHEPGKHWLVKNAFFTPDGKKIISYNDPDNQTNDLPITIRIWDTGTGKRVIGPWDEEMRGHGTIAALSSDGRYLAVASAKRKKKEKNEKNYSFITTIGCFDIAQSKSLPDVMVDGKVQALSFADNGETIITVGSTDMHWWNLATGKSKSSWQPFEKDASITARDPKKFVFISNCFFTADAKYFVGNLTRAEHVSESQSKSLGVATVMIDMTARIELWRNESSSPMSFSADGKRVALRIKSDELEVRQTLDGRTVAVPNLKNAFRYSLFAAKLSLSGDKLAAVGFAATTIVLWSSTEPKELRSISMDSIASNDTRAYLFCFSPDDKSVLVGFGSSLRLYDVKTRQEVNSSPGHHGCVDYVVFTNDGKELVTANATGSYISREVVRWETMTWKAIQKTSDRMPQFSEFAKPSPEHTYCMDSTADDRYKLYNMADGTLLGRLSALPQDPATMGFFLRGSKFYMLWSRDKTGKDSVYLYEVPSGRLVCKLPMLASNSQWILPITSSPDNRLTAFLAQDGGQIHVIENSTGKTIHRFGEVRDDFAIAHSLAFSSNGNLLATGRAFDGVLRIWDMASGKYRQTIPDSAYQGAMQLAFSSDGRMLAIGGRKIQLLELQTMKIRQEFTGHNGLITSLAFSPDGRLLASGSTDTTVLIWDVWSR